VVDPQISQMAQIKKKFCGELGALCSSLLLAFGSVGS
jgi:hypothetical protein